jgi:hypothetical protein
MSDHRIANGRQRSQRPSKGSGEVIGGHVYISSSSLQLASTTSQATCAATTFSRTRASSSDTAPTTIGSNYPPPSSSESTVTPQFRWRMSATLHLPWLRHRHEEARTGNLQLLQRAASAARRATVTYRGLTLAADSIASSILAELRYFHSVVCTVSAADARCPEYHAALISCLGPGGTLLKSLHWLHAPNPVT